MNQVTATLRNVRSYLTATATILNICLKFHGPRTVSTSADIYSRG